MSADEPHRVPARVSRRQALRFGALGVAGLGLAPWLVACGTDDSGSAATTGGTAGSGTAPTGGNMVVALNGMSDTAGFNQSLAYDGGSQFPSTLIFSRLTVMDYGPEFAIHPQLATSWEVSPDAKEYTFTLDPKAMWHDGKPVTSEDVKVTYEGIIANSGPAAGLLKVIKTIETPDAHTVKFLLSESNAALLYAISVYPRTSILPAHLYSGTDWKTNPANMAPVGSGPYKFAGYTPGQQILLEANPDYFGGTPSLSKVAFQFVPTEQTALAGLRSGQFQALAFPPSLTLVGGLQKEAGVAVEAPPGPWSCYLGFNQARTPIDDLQVRQAITTAIDRATITSRVTAGVATAATGPFVPSTPWAFDEKAAYPAFDVAAANALLDTAGHARGADGNRFSLSFLVSSNDFYNDVAQVLKSQLAEVGIVLEINLVDRPTFMAQAKELNHDVIIDALWIGPDPNEWAQQIGTGGAYNRTGYSNEEIDALFLEGVASSDEATRAESYFKIQEIVVEDLPYTNIFAAPYSFVHSAGWKGFFSQDGSISYRLDLTKVTKA
ncbi:hypothetical protein GIS00_20285 [Nakamurella sp. YIM 132087]|uniref:Solute-binding protein family 5 domain-containing protein n=1 Tax=Nakamurella alba TaxID=2665158 RepID=A0A7K1FQ56_9ACTN|nr:ABC transporter substrate-binding protein [Nakamurella alba]MTD16282.1 hypothetical protein [Nakamurella alba]